MGLQRWKQKGYPHTAAPDGRGRWYRVEDVDAEIERLRSALERLATISAEAQKVPAWTETHDRWHAETKRALGILSDS